MKYLIAGLGNIGPEYVDTRHNIGFMVVNSLAEKHGVKMKLDRHAYSGEFSYKGRTFYMIMPTTYMNLSGKAVNHHLKEQKIPQENLLVITDDLALPFGTLRLRGKGSNGGHNGLKHIEETLGNNNYARLRFGVGSDFPKGRQVDYVLSPFSDAEFSELPALIERSCDITISFAAIGLERTMSQFNKGPEK